MKIDPKTLRKAEEFADADEADMRSIGANADYFCSEQRQRWRLEAIKAFLGLMPDEEIEIARPDKGQILPKVTL